MKKEKLNELILKYSTQGPRYTSYPPVPFWKNPPTQEKWFNEIKRNYINFLDLELKNAINLFENVKESIIDKNDYNKKAIESANLFST